MSNVVVAVVEHDNHFAFLQRMDGRWTFPSGKIEQGETIEEAVKREVSEETGLTVAVLTEFGSREVDDHNLTYALCSVRGGSLKLTEPDKFKQAIWLTPQQVLNLKANDIFEPVKQYLGRFMPSSMPSLNRG